ncbi:MAG: hypothetical protein MUP15_10590, partial [Dehalococcoidia bacterium]|nr:hypothetical protein [Dehalococcoidia bacterium]
MKRRIAVLAALLALVSLVASHAAPSSFLELDNNIRANNTGTPPPYDWANSGTLTAPTTPGGVWTVNGVNGIFDGGVFNGQPTPPSPPSKIASDPTIVDAEFLVDPLAQDVTSCGGGDPTVYTGAGGETNGELFSTMTWSTGSVPPKDEISNVYALAHRVGSTNEVFFGAERIVNDGDSHIDFEFLQSEVTRTGTCSGGFVGNRSQGDLLLAVDFTRGGLGETPTLYEWHCLAEGGTQLAIGTVCNPPAHGQSIPQYQPLTSGPALSAVTFGVNSTGPVDCGGWVCRDKGAGSSTTVDTNEFMEGGINFAELGFSGCISTFLPHTRSSQSFTATLKDFGGPIPFNTCAPSTTDTQASTNATNVVPGTSVTDTATVSGSAGTPTGTVDFFLCQPSEVTGGGCEGTAGTKISATKTLASGQATSDATTNTTTLGKYCWRAEYTPAAGSAYLASSHTDATDECFTVTKQPSTTDTQASTNATNVVPGTSVTDTATVSGSIGTP